MQIQAQIAEANLGLIHVGDPVEIELNWNSDAEVRYSGVVSMISAIADSSSGDGMGSSENVTYTVYIDFTPDSDTRYGMTAVVSTLDEEIVEEEAAEEAPVEKDIPEGEFSFDKEFAPDGEGMPESLMDFGGPMGGGGGHVKE